jgi:hypothetical protein
MTMGYRPYEGHDVTESGIEMPGAGGGFHKSLAVDGLELEHRERVTLAVEVEVAKVRHDLVHPDLDPDDMADDDDRDPNALRRVHVLKVIGAARIPDEMVRAQLDAQAARVAEVLAAEKAERDRARKAAKGELPFPDGDAALCAHDLDPAECDDCQPLPLDTPEDGHGDVSG